MLSDGNWTILAGFVVTRSMVLRTKGHENVYGGHPSASPVVRDFIQRISKTLRRKCVWAEGFGTFWRLRLDATHHWLNRTAYQSTVCTYPSERPRIFKVHDPISIIKEFFKQCVFFFFFGWSSREVSQTPSRQASISINEISGLSKYSWCSVQYNTVTTWAGGLLDRQGCRADGPSLAGSEHIGDLEYQQVQYIQRSLMRPVLKIDMSRSTVTSESQPLASERRSKRLNCPKRTDQAIAFVYPNISVI